METAIDVMTAGAGGSSAFLTRMRDGGVVPVVQFGGQAGAYWPELAGAYQESFLARECIEQIARELKCHAANREVVATVFLPYGLDVLSWITNPSSLPSPEYLSSSVVSQPLIFLTQISNILRLLDGSNDAQEVLDRASTFIGHSQGVMTATCFSIGYPAKHFNERVAGFASYFFWQGVRMQQAFPASGLPKDILAIGTIEGEGTPSPMAAITGFTVAEADELVSEANRRLPKEQGVFRDLINGWNRVVVAGPTESLIQLRLNLKEKLDKWEKDPILRRKIRWEYIATSAPFHTPYMGPGLDSFKSDLKRLGFVLDAAQLKKPVIATNNAANLQNSKDALSDLLTMQWLEGVDWPKVVQTAIAHATHVVDFGPGESAAKLTQLNVDGRGVAVIPAATPAGRRTIFAPDETEIPWGEDWGEYRPKVVRIADCGLRIDNKFTRFTGMPPVFGGGMTPTTTETEIVTTAANSGYLVEWAGGGQVAEAIWRTRLDELRRDLKPGRGVIFNALFLDPYLWNLHYPKIIELKKEGYPIVGMTISAGLPDLPKASEILKELNNAGIWLNAFKPGSDATIKRLLEIADANPQYTIMMHVEGGKAGGHHSWEDIRGLITRNYARIRRRKNVVLCVGGGVTAPEEAASWLMGTWQTNADLPPMPVDGVILGTRLMACKEAKTSQQVKKALVALSGTTEWVRKNEVKGGITSQESQLGADVYFAESAAARAGTFLDKMAGRPLQEILKHKPEIIGLIDKTAKPYFGELPEMTYAAVLKRMIELMAPGKIATHLPHDGPWYDISFRKRAFEWARRVEERFAAGGTFFVNDLIQLDDPHGFVRELCKQYSAANTTLLHPEDVDWFVHLCLMAGKPVNFVPVIDENVRKWYKADSLWQSHDPRYPADAVFTIPGPEAVRGITRADEPVAEIFEMFEGAVIKVCGRVTSFAALPIDALPNGHVESSRKGDQVSFVLHANDRAFTEDGKAWREWAASQGNGPISAFLSAERIFQANGNECFASNPLCKVMYPQPSHSWRITLKRGRIVEVYTPSCSMSENNELIVLRVGQLELHYTYHPDCGLAPIHEVMEGREERIAGFYAHAWGIEDGHKATTGRLKIGETFRSETVVTRDTIEVYCIATGETRSFIPATNACPPTVQWRDQRVPASSKLCGGPATQCGGYGVVAGLTTVLAAPPNMSIVHAWGAFAQCLLACGQAASLLDLLHLSNSYRFLTDKPIVEGNRLTAELAIDRIEQRTNGFLVGVTGMLSRKGEKIVELGSEFFVRGSRFEVRGSKFEVGTSNIEHRTPPATGDVIALPVPYDIASGEVIAPASAVQYAAASRDTNPIHTDPAIAALAGLDRPIMHGMWSSAALLREVTKEVAKGDAGNITFFETRFARPVYPAERLNYSVRHIGMSNGERALDVTLSSAKGVAVSARAHAREGRIAYLFTGQGSQMQGMGMDGYARSAAACAVWNAADAHCRQTFGFSILHIVKENPREMLVRGERLRHPQGVLHLTQFTQVALTVLAMAQVAELREAGCYDDRAMYAGHSLGEYAALSATGILPLTEVVDVVYHRGLTMQHFVPRDAKGVSPYGMAVVRPNIVGMSEEGLLQLVSEIAGKGQGPLEVVNLNIAGEQYSVTGETRLLYNLRRKLVEEETRRGATKPSYIFLEGIDVPFHSTVLRNGVDAFRKTLLKCIPTEIDPSGLEDRYIPNLTATPFRLDRRYVREVYELTQSPVLQRLLKSSAATSAKQPPPGADPPRSVAEADRGDVRLLLIELLAYQFASPVQWIRTQSVLFDDPAHAVDRVIEIGPQPVLVGMAKRTLARGHVRIRPPRMWHVEQDRREVFYVREVEVVPMFRSSDVPRLTSDIGTTNIEHRNNKTDVLPDEPLSIRDALFNLLALKLKLRPDEISDSSTVEKLCGGNSARRNEILADIGAEFNAGAIDDAQNKPLAELVSLLEKKTKYSTPGPFLRVSADQAIKATLPVSRKAVIDYLAAERCLPEGRVLAVLNLLPVAVRGGDSLGSGPMSPIGVGARLKDETSAKEWLDKLADWYGQLKGVAVPRRGGGDGGAAAAMVDAAALTALEAKYFGKDGVLTRAANELLSGSGVDPYVRVLEEDREFLEQNRRLSLYTRELGPQFERVIAPLFDEKKAVLFTSVWNWVRRDVVEFYYDVVAGRRSLHTSGGHAPVVSNQTLQHITNAADSRTLATIHYYRKKAEVEKISKVAGVFVDLERAVKSSIDKPSRYVGPSGAQKLAKGMGGGLGNILQSVAEKGLSLSGKRILITGAGPGSIGSALVANFLAAGATVVVTTTTVLPTSRTRGGEGGTQQALPVGGDATTEAGDPQSGSPRKYPQPQAKGTRVPAGRVEGAPVIDERTRWWRSIYSDNAGRGAILHVIPANQGNKGDIDAIVDWMAHQYGGVDACYPFGAVKESGDLTTMDPASSSATWRVLVQGVEWLVAAVARAQSQHAVPGERVAVVLPLSPNHGQFGGDGAYSESKAALEVLLNRWRSEQAAWGKYVALIGAQIGWTRGTGLMSANDAIADAIEKETGCKTFSTEEMGFLLTALVHPKAVTLAGKCPLRIDYTGGFGGIPDVAALVRRLRAGRQSPVAGSATDPSADKRQSPAVLQLPATGNRRPATAVKADPRHFSFPSIPSAEALAQFPNLHHIDTKEVFVVVGYGEVSPFGNARTRWEAESGGGFSIGGWLELAWLMGLVRYESNGTHVGWVDAKSGEPIVETEIGTRFADTILNHTGIRVCESELQGFDPRALRVWADVQLEEDFVVPVESREQGEAMLAKYNGQAELVTRDQNLYVRLKKGSIIKVARESRFPRYAAGQLPAGWDATRYGIPKELVAQVDRNTLFNIVATVEAFISAGCTPQELYDHFHPTRVGNSQGGGMGGMQALTHLYRAHREGQQRKGDALQETLINVCAAWATQSYVGSYGPTVHPVGACATAVVSLDVAVNLLAVGKADFVVAGGYDDYSSEGVIGFNDMEATADVDAMLAKGLSVRSISRPNDRRRGGFVEAQGGGTLLVTRLDHAVKVGLPIYAVVGHVATHSDGIHTSIPAPGLGLLGMAAGGAKSPVANALSRFGLTADDIAVVSKHDTSTKANDPNENQLHHLMQQALGRSEGNPLIVHSQKAWLGHSKGGAGAWQANAAIQMLLSGTIPGNPNLDDVDPAMTGYSTMCFTDRPLDMGEGNCCAVIFTSLGFGHVGGGALFIHPDYALRTLSRQELLDYARRRAKREEWYRRRSWEILLGKSPAYERRTEKPFRTTDEEANALLTSPS